MRDPFNNLASRLRLYSTRGKEFGLKRERLVNDFPARWLDYYKASKDRLYLKIDYNSWFDSEDYRREFCEANSATLDIEFNDAFLNTVSTHGQGSSFDGTNFNTYAQKMNVHGRWKNRIKDDSYWEVLAGGGAEFLDALEELYGNKEYLQEPIEILKKKLD